MELIRTLPDRQRTARTRRAGREIYIYIYLYIVPNFRIRHWDQYYNVRSKSTTGGRFRTPTVNSQRIDRLTNQDISF